MDPSVERDLLVRARNHDQSAFVCLIEQYRRLVLSLAFQMTGSTADMDDLAQETFLRAYRNLNGFRGDASFKTWLVRIVMNLSSNYRRSQRAHSDAERAGALDFMPPPQGAESQMLSAELRAKVRQVVADLPDQLRNVVVLRDYQSMSYREIADSLGIPIGTVMSRLAKARERLRASLAQYCGRDVS